MAAVEALAHGMSFPVAVQIPNDRFPPSVESAAYFVVAQALTNVAKYANPETARVVATSSDGRPMLTNRGRWRGRCAIVHGQRPQRSA